MSVTVAEDAMSAVVRLSGLSFDDFDRTGKLGIWQIGKLFLCGRVLAIRGGRFLLGRRLMEDDGMFFVVVCDYSISEGLYRRTAGMNLSVPLNMKSHLVSFGKSSLELLTTIEDAERNTTLATLKFRYAQVNRRTRKSKALPDYFIQAYASRKADHQRPRDDTRHILDIPSSAHSYDVTVRYSDTDFNKHTNNCEYIKFCMDAATSASLENKLNYFTGDVCRYRVKSMKVFYLAETLAGDDLKVFLWEDDNKTDTLYFNVQKNRKACCGVTIQFDNQEASRL